SARSRAGQARDWMTQQLRTAASPMFKVDLLAAGISRDVRQNRPGNAQSFGIRRRNPSGPARCEHFRDGPGRPHAARAQVWISRRFRPSSCVPTWSRPLAADFHPLAAELAADPAKPRLVLAIDYRAHGQSEYAPNPDNYTLPVALADLSAVLIALEIAPAIFLGTSYGGLLAMMLAVWRPTAIGGAILNDI